MGKLAGKNFQLYWDENLKINLDTDYWKYKVWMIQKWEMLTIITISHINFPNFFSYR